MHVPVRLRTVATLVALAALALVALTLPSAGSAAPTAVAAKACKPPKYPGVGYFTSINVTGVDCATGTKLVNAYYKCRIAKGGKKGTCPAVMGYKCKEKRNSIPTEIDAQVTCTSGSKKVVHTYQQDI
jgi:hypothetical protein